MKSNRNRNRGTFQLESLEGRLALSGMSGAVEGIHHHRGGHAAEVQTLRHGADDPANHDATDDNGTVDSGQPGADDPANHDATDDKGGANASSRHGADHVNVSATAGSHRQRHGHHGANHPAGHK